MKIKLSTIVEFFLVSAVIGVAISYDKFYLFHFALFILILTFSLIKSKSGKKITPRIYTRLHYIFYFMFLWYLLSLLWSINIEYTVIYLFYIICGIFIVLALIYYMNTIDIQNRVFKILSIVFIIEIILSLLEAFTSFRLPISPYSPYVKYFGREMKIGDLQDDIVNVIMQSPTGFQWNPNNLAVTFLIIAPFFLLYKNRFIKCFGLLAIGILIIMSGSRGAFIAFIFMLSLYMFVLSKKRFLIFTTIIPFIFILAFSSYESIKNSENPKIREIATSFNVLMTYLFEDVPYDNSIGIRQQLISNGLYALKKSYYLGVGGGGSKAVNESIGGVAGKINSMHNFWIEILVDSGIVFTVIFISWYIYLTLKLYLIGIKTKNYIFRYYAQSLFLSMTAFSIGSISASSVIYLFPMWIMYGFAIATINNYRRYCSESLNAIRS